jgi:ATP-dependent DNA helicase RecG
LSHLYSDIKVMRIKDHNRISELYFRKRNIFTEGKIFPALKLEDFKEILFDRARGFIRSKRVDHPWLEEDNKGMLRLSNFYRKDFSTGEEGSEREYFQGDCGKYYYP